MYQSSILSLFGESLSQGHNDRTFTKDVEFVPKIIHSDSDNSNDDIFLTTNKTLNRRTTINSDIGCSDDDSTPIKALKVDNVDEPIENTNRSPIDYDPFKTSYDIISDACWRTNEMVPYLALARTFDAIESMSQPLRATRVLSNFLRSVIHLSSDDLIPCIYLCVNRVAPDYEGTVLAVEESLIIEALAQATDTSQDALSALLKVEGDIGDVAHRLTSSHQNLRAPRSLTVRTVFNRLKELARTSGEGAQRFKVEIIKDMFIAGRGCEKKFLARALNGDLRIGLAEQTVMASLGEALTLTPTGDRGCASKVDGNDALESLIDGNTALLRNAYSECPNYDRIITTVMTHSLDDLPQFCSITPGIPVKPMHAAPSRGVSEIITRFDGAAFSCEFKYKGERAQIHARRDIENCGKIVVKVFSRNLENITAKYPQIVRIVTSMVEESGVVDSFIMDSKVVRRRRKTKEIKEKEASIYAFDLLYFNGESLLRRSFRERREALRKHFKQKLGQYQYAITMDTVDTDSISMFFDLSIERKCQGLIFKALDTDATYEISRRSHKWHKLEQGDLNNLGDSLDLVVIGAIFGHWMGKKKYGNFLMACYEPDSGTYQSVCRLEKGLSDVQMDEVYEVLSHKVARWKPLRYDIDSAVHVDVWFEPAIVWEVTGADLSISPRHKAAIGIANRDRGIGLTFPRFLKARAYKYAEEATTATRIAEMYLRQEKSSGATRR